MDIRFIHFYPDLMSLYGSYANVAVLKRYLEGLGNTVSVETVLPGQKVDLAGADFLYMGAGTERSQKAALADFAGYSEAVKALAEVRDVAVSVFEGSDIIRHEVVSRIVAAYDRYEAKQAAKRAQEKKE